MEMIQMSDPYLLRDGEGNPLSSIFHQLSPADVLSFFWCNEPMEIHELDENVVKKYFRELKEKKEAEK